jgi:hypothetical protein
LLQYRKNIPAGIPFSQDTLTVSKSIKVYLYQQLLLSTIIALKNNLILFKIL